LEAITSPISNLRDEACHSFLSQLFCDRDAFSRLNNTAATFAGCETYAAWLPFNFNEIYALDVIK